jgi:vacuolar-type H+-ATPase subunit E/Vma4
MINEIRNELLLILDLEKENEQEDKDFKIDWLLERFESDIKRQLEDTISKENELKNNLELLEYVRGEIKKIRGKRK